MLNALGLPPGNCGPRAGLRQPLMDVNKSSMLREKQASMTGRIRVVMAPLVSESA